MNQSRGAFTVESAITNLAVTVQDRAVTRIELNRRGSRSPEGRFEQLVARELGQYLAGERTQFTFAISTEGSAFYRRVWHELGRIPYGHTISYGELARRVGKPKAARAVGTANGKNPIPIVIPCHRVVAAGGKLGGYGGGLPLKRRLLDLEAAHCPAIR
ncbi:MAG: methylated-DNA--[protein]-cysteine S-methyltransferase [Gemmatimonadota bacterium]|nr:MAG: methylated-DNA--[protein]-cysteine S-methyltransferase [Gemmatimonadota bacterium]